jgi:glycosyltransferase involved in cell wall biosynthesis
MAPDRCTFTGHVSLMHILVVTHYFPEHGGGVEIAAREIAVGLIARGFTIEWIASRERAHPTSAPGAQPVGALNVSERLCGIPYPIWGPEALRTINRALERSDILHLHDTLYSGNVLAHLRARRLRKPVVVTQHVGLVPYRNRVLRGMMDAANRLVAARILEESATTVFCSKTTERYFTPMLSAQARTAWIPNGLDTTLYTPLPDASRRRLRAALGWPEERAVFLFVGRFVEKKGLAILEQLVRRFDAALWVFVGWGPLDPASWGAANVISLGRRTQQDIVPLYQAADLLVLPSVGEGFPLVVQESLACATPALVSTETARAYPGLQAVVWAAEPAVPDFTQQIDGLLSQPGSLAEARERSREFARAEWSWAACADQYAELMRSVCAR